MNADKTGSTGGQSGAPDGGGPSRPAGRRSLVAAFRERWDEFWLGAPGPRKTPLQALLAVVAVIVVLYYPVGMMLAHQVNDDLAFESPEAFRPAGASRAVAMAVALIGREVAETTWVANKPFIFPSSVLDNMPNFQTGMIYALSRLPSR